MNFKTTVVLIVLLAAAGVALFFTKDREKKEGEADTAAKSAQKIFDVGEGGVAKLAVTSSADGKKLTLEKNDVGRWRLTEPVNAPADTFAVDALVRSVAALQSHSEVGGSADAKSTGLDNPRYTIDLTAKDGKSYTLLVGDKLAVGDNLYVLRKDKGQTLVVSADLLDKLDKPAGDYRDKKLINDFNTAGITQVILTKPDGKIVISRKNAGEDWKITEPSAMPAERADVDAIVTSLTDLRANEFVSDDPAQAKLYQLDPARMTAVLSSEPPATQPASKPATSQPAPIVIRFGRYDDVLKTNVYAETSQSPAIATVSASSLDSINKKPLDLRDRRAADLDPMQVSSVRIVSDVTATTKPTSRPASKKEVTLARRREPPVLVLAPTTKSSSTQASTSPSTTKPSTVATSQPASKWEVAASATTKPSAAEDAKVDQLLASLHPLRVRKYLEKVPSTQPSATYTLKITTQAAGGAAPVEHEITLVDPGNSGDVTGTYNGLAFEVDRFFLDQVTGDFLKGSKPAMPPGAMPGAMPGGFGGPGANEGPIDTVGP